MSIMSNTQNYLANLAMKQKFLEKSKTLQAEKEVNHLEYRMNNLPENYKNRGSLFLATKAAELAQKRNNIIKENPNVQTFSQPNNLSLEQKNERFAKNEKKIDSSIIENNLRYNEVNTNLEKLEKAQDKSVFVEFCE